MAETGGLVFVSGLDDEMQNGYFSATYDTFANWNWNLALPTMVIQPDKPYVVHLMWNVPGFGKVLVKADNGGKGYLLDTSGSSIAININYEIARSCVEAFTSESRGKNNKDIKSAKVNLEKARVFIEDSRMADAVSEIDTCLQLILSNLEDIALSEAQLDIEKYRQGDLNIRIVDNLGQPVSNTQFSYQQTSHDFQFGAKPLGLNGIYDASIAQIMQEAGFNQTNITVRWGLIETSPGTFSWNNIDDQQQINELISQ